MYWHVSEQSIAGSCCTESAVGGYKSVHIELSYSWHPAQQVMFATEAHQQVVATTSHTSTRYLSALPHVVMRSRCRKTSWKFDCGPHPADPRCMHMLWSAWHAGCIVLHGHQGFEALELVPCASYSNTRSCCWCWLRNCTSTHNQLFAYVPTAVQPGAWDTMH